MPSSSQMAATQRRRCTPTDEQHCSASEGVSWWRVAPWVAGAHCAVESGRSSLCRGGWQELIEQSLKYLVAARRFLKAFEKGECEEASRCMGTGLRMGC